MSEKTEKASHYKLQKAKEKGQVSKSVDLAASLNLLVMLGMITALWPKQLQELQKLLRHQLYLVARLQFGLDNMNHLSQFIWAELLNLWLPFALAGMVAMILAHIAQTGMIWSTTPLIPDFKRLHPREGLKKIFSLKTCFETGKNTLKLICSILFLLIALRHHTPELMQLSVTSIAQQPVIIMHFLLKILFQLLLLLSAFTILDTWYTRWSYARSQRMSKQEVKDEYKQREGDPKIKQKIKQLQQQLRQKTASLKQVKTADIVLTNPTHLAIALKYDRHSMPAPKVVCKAQGELVVHVKKLARRYGVPVIEHKHFARMLYHSVGLNQWINKEHYPFAAVIFKEIYAQRNSSK